MVCCLAHRGSTGDSLLLKIFSGDVCLPQGSQAATQHVVSVESSSLILHDTFRDDLFVYPDNSLIKCKD